MTALLGGRVFVIDRFNQLAGVVSRMNKSVQRIKREGVEDLGLKGAHVMCLHKLSSAPGGLTAAELSEACQEDKAAISRSVAELQERGLVEVAPGKKYRAAIRLTDQGREAAACVNERIVRAVTAISVQMTPEQRRMFYETLEAVANSLGDFSFSDDALPLGDASASGDAAVSGDAPASGGASPSGSISPR